MPGRDHFFRLHDDLVTSILIRLPPKMIALARIVCRRWHALTTDHLFVRVSISHGRPIAGFFFNHPWGTASEYFPLDPGADEEAAAGYRVAPDLSFIPGARPADPDRVLVRGSCGGLLLLLCLLSGCRAIRYYVCNPLTKKLLPIVLPSGVLFCVNIAFDASKSQHYKLIALDDMHRIHVYSSETQSWRKANLSDHSASLLHGACPTRGVFWVGSMVWIVAHSLVRFIIEDEHVTKMPMPSREKDWICAYIGDSGGQLQMIGYTKKDKLTACFDILEMQENKSEWSVLHRIDLNRVKELYPDIEWPTWDTRNHQHKIIDYLALSPIYVIRGTGKTGQHGMLVFSIPGKIMSYNMEDQEISVVKEIGMGNPYQLEQFWYTFFAYSPCLFAV